MEFKDYYKLLGVSRDASPEEIKKAYRRLARKYHPDVSKEADAEERFKEVSEAYEVLQDPEKRATYDQFGQGYHAGDEFRPPPGWQGDVRFTDGFGGFTSDADVFSEFFESLFGGRPGGAGQAGFGQRSGPQRGSDQRSVIRVPLETIYTGGEHQVRLQDPGARSGQRALKVKIPRGIRSGAEIRLPGQGGRGPGGQGDLYLQIEYEKHPLFEVDGRDIVLDVPVAPWEAALGATLAVPTLGGKVDLKIPAGSQSGRRMRLKGRGLPGSPPGDQYVRLQIYAPSPRNEEEKELYREMSRRLEFTARRF